MAADEIRADYDQLAQVASKFSNQSQADSGDDPKRPPEHGSPCATVGRVAARRPSSPKCRARFCRR